MTNYICSKAVRDASDILTHVPFEFEQDKQTRDSSIEFNNYCSYILLVPEAASRGSQAFSRNVVPNLLESKLAGCLIVK